jgi:hypothetical protein
MKPHEKVEILNNASLVVGFQAVWQVGEFQSESFLTWLSQRREFITETSEGD